MEPVQMPIGPVSTSRLENDKEHNCEQACIKEDFSALNSELKVYNIYPQPWNKQDSLLFLASNKNKIENILQLALTQNKAVKFYFCLKARYVKSSENNTDVTVTSPYFRSSCESLTFPQNIERKVITSYQKILTAMQEFESRGSGWSMDMVILLALNIARYRPLAGST